jgi:hypothetical protein
MASLKLVSLDLKFYWAGLDYHDHIFFSFIKYLNKIVKMNVRRYFEKLSGS